MQIIFVSDVKVIVLTVLYEYTFVYFQLHAFKHLRMM